MKILLLIILLVITSGCATMGAFARGYSKGYNDTMAAQGKDEKKTTNCNSYINGNYVNTNCN